MQIEDEEGELEMKLRDGLIREKIDQDFITVFTSDSASEFHGLMRSNRTTEFILDCLMEETDESRILEKMMEQYDGDPKEMEEDITMVLAILRKADALLEEKKV